MQYKVEIPFLAQWKCQKGLFSIWRVVKKGTGKRGIGNLNIPHTNETPISTQVNFLVYHGHCTLSDYSILWALSLAVYSTLMVIATGMRENNFASNKSLMMHVVKQQQTENFLNLKYLKKNYLFHLIKRVDIIFRLLLSISFNNACVATGKDCKERHTFCNWHYRI